VAIAQQKGLCGKTLTKMNFVIATKPAFSAIAWFGG